MQFTYKSYQSLINALKKKYNFANYHNYDSYDKAVILRHDVDNDLSKAFKLAKLEHDLDVSSTYFVLLKTDFYNVASQKSLRYLKEMQEMGHEVGLHFDEMAYSKVLPQNELVEKVLEETTILADILGTPIRTVSMHRPSKNTLESDIQFPNIVNSYSKTFFRDFKYISDSRRNWREPVDEIVAFGKYERLHILTHAFWYHEKELSMKETIADFIKNAKYERYSQLNDNLTDLSSVLLREEI